MVGFQILITPKIKLEEVGGPIVGKQAGDFENNSVPCKTPGHIKVVVKKHEI